MHSLIFISFVILYFAHIFTFIFYFGVIDGWTHVYLYRMFNFKGLILRKLNKVVLPLQKETSSSFLQKPDFHSF